MALTLTSEGAIKRWLSVEGLELRTDHSAESLAEANVNALGEMEFYLADRYRLDSPEVLASRWLQQVTLIFTLFHLFSQRNDQPASNIVSLRQGYLENLEKIRIGDAVIPGVPTGSTCAPALLNMSVVHDAYPSLFVDKRRSVMPAENPGQPRFRPNEFPRPPRI